MLFRSVGIFLSNARINEKVFYEVDRESVSSIFKLISDRPVSIGFRLGYAWHR